MPRLDRTDNKRQADATRSSPEGRGLAPRRAAGLPDAEPLVLPEAGHFPFGEQPETFATAMRQLLAAVPAGVGAI